MFQSGVAVTVCGRAFALRDLDLVRQIIEKEPRPHRREIARQVCTQLRWVRPDGRLKEMSCRVALLRLEALGFLRLPPPLTRNGNRRPYQPRETLVAPEVPILDRVEGLAGLRLRVVTSARESRLWNEAVSRFHYLGYRRLPGAQGRYLVEAERGLLGVVGFGASAWKVAPRDRWIGWSDLQRRARLHLVVNNARFLLLPWVRSQNLASWVLGQCARRLPEDWEGRYGYRPVLLETFVEQGRFRGTCYRAANWACLGETQGRGKLDRHKRFGVPVKAIFVYPLVRDFREALTS